MTDEHERPLGLNDKDNLGDCLARANELSNKTGYSGMLYRMKDLRRIVLLADIVELQDVKLKKATQQLQEAREKDLFDFMIWYKNTVPIGTTMDAKEIVDDFLNKQDKEEQQ